MADSKSKAPSKSVLEQYFYAAATAALLVLTIVGFQLFYFHGQAYPGRPLTPPIRSLIIAHGVAMSLWLLLAVVQPSLVAGGKRRAHMALGKVGVALALVLIPLGIKLGIEAARVAPPGLMFGPLTPKQFMAVPVLTMVFFTCVIALGLAWRKRAEWHRALMFTGTLAATGAGISRIDAFNHLYAGTIFQMLFGDLFFTLVVGAVLVLARFAVLQKVDRPLGLCFGALTLWVLVIVHGAPTAAWDQIASFLLG